MNYKWFDQFEARARGICCIRADRDQQSNRTADRAQSATTRGGGGGRTGTGTAYGAALGNKVDRDRLNSGGPDQGGSGPGHKNLTGRTENPGGGRANGTTDRPNKPAGGSATSWSQEPGSVANNPFADTPTVLEKVVGPVVPGLGGSLGVGTVAKMLADQTMGPTTLLGGNPGPQVGWQRDRGKGASSFNPNDPRGETSVEREIPGRRIGAGTDALTDDPSTNPPSYPAPTELYSDIQMQDRRKPRPALVQMLEAML